MVQLYLLAYGRKPDQQLDLLIVLSREDQRLTLFRGNGKEKWAFDTILNLGGESALSLSIAVGACNLPAEATSVLPSIYTVESQCNGGPTDPVLRYIDAAGLAPATHKLPAILLLSHIAQVRCRKHSRVAIMRNGLDTIVTGNTNRLEEPR
jgi:hypothetical protein